MPTVIMLALLLSQTGSEPERGADYAHYNRFTKFDQYFSKYSKRHFGVGFDWRYFKAQAIAESNLRPAVTSRAGAVGVMQIMPRTYEEIRNKNPGIRGSAEQPRWNIAAGIWYDRQNFVVWTERRPLLDKIKFMFGSYNAGRASILRAQRVAAGDGWTARSGRRSSRACPVSPAEAAAKRCGMSTGFSISSRCFANGCRHRCDQLPVRAGRRLLDDHLHGARLQSVRPDDAVRYA